MPQIESRQERVGGLATRWHAGRTQPAALAILRITIGWHLLYEGVAKILNPYWSAAAYLSDSQWILSGLFLRLAADPTVLSVVDLLNKWGLTFIGLGLMLGLLTRAATVSGIVLLSLYYLSSPPFVGYEYTIPSGGNTLIVNQVLVEMIALVVTLLFPTGRIIGLDRLIYGTDGSV